jgi:hypothetical protein
MVPSVTGTGAFSLRVLATFAEPLLVPFTNPIALWVLASIDDQKPVETAEFP